MRPRSPNGLRIRQRKAQCGGLPARTQASPHATVEAAHGRSRLGGADSMHGTYTEMEGEREREMVRIDQFGASRRDWRHQYGGLPVVWARIREFCAAWWRRRFGGLVGQFALCGRQLLKKNITVI